MQFENEEIDDESPLVYSIDNAILMHRDTHFGGNFSLMLEYYRSDGKGINKNFEISRIENLQEIEVKEKKNLSPLMLSGAEAEKVAEAVKAYRELRELYTKKTANKKALLIADLILCEEEETEKAIEAVVAEKGAIVPLLIDLIRSENFHDSLFPGYGEAPFLAAKCLGRIGDKRALISLFELLGEGDFFNETIILDALYAIGESAKLFLLKVLEAHPLTYDNEKAALALLNFKNDPEVSLASLKILKEIEIAKHESLATYLVLDCEGLPEYARKELIALGENPKTPKTLRLDIDAIVKSWN
jgi:HEAT repeat protein